MGEQEAKEEDLTQRLIKLEAGEKRHEEQVDNYADRVNSIVSREKNCEHVEQENHKLREANAVYEERIKNCNTREVSFREQQASLVKQRTLLAIDQLEFERRKVCYELEKATPEQRENIKAKLAIIDDQIRRRRESANLSRDEIATDLGDPPTGRDDEYE